MDLPTYTNIWRIEKRLYKLYDFRLPAPLPINWIAVFTGITIPYIVLLVAIGLPFNHTLVWLYVLPPGVLTWLTTRPVIENKRLPELLESQIRYLTEPKVWCRLAPLSEKDQIVVTARVWHSRRAPQQRKTRAGAVALRGRGTLARRSQDAPVPAEAAEGAAPVVSGAVMATAAPASAPPVRHQTRYRVRGGGVEAPAPASAAKQRLSARQGRPVRQGQPAQQPQTPRRARGGAQQTRVTRQAQAPQQIPADGQQPAQQDPASKPSRFRLAALGSRPAGPAPALPPGVALKPPAGPGQPRPADAEQPRPAGPARALPAARFAPSLGPVAAPVRSDMPVHATPDVHPATPAPGWPVPPAVPGLAAQAVAPGVAAPEDAPTERATDGRERTAPEGIAADQAASPRASGAPEDVAAPVRVRGNGTGAPRIEMTHTGPAPRPMPPAPVPPVNPAHGWPVPARPPHPSVQSPVPSATPPASVAPETHPHPGDEVVSADGTEQRPEQVLPVAEAAVGEEATVEAQQPVRERVQAQAPVVKAVAEAQNRVPSIERALSGPSRDRNLSWHGKVKIVTSATQGPGARDQEALDRARARLPLKSAQRVLMLGCTSGAGQTVTTLMTGHILASLREHPVAAVDLHDGTLGRYSAPAAWLGEIFSGKTPERQRPARPDGLNPARKDAPNRLDVIASDEPLRDGDELKLAVQLGRHYPLTMLDPGAAGLTKLLKITDQLVVVVPASMEGAGALADTRDWLDAHGFADLATHSVTLINGVSRRSLADVEHAESVAHGRCRAIVRVPWDDMLPVGVPGPSTLRPQTRVAYTALAGVLVAGMAAAPIRKQQ